MTYTSPAELRSKLRASAMTIKAMAGTVQGLRAQLEAANQRHAAALDAAPRARDAALDAAVEACQNEQTNALANDCKSEALGAKWCRDAVKALLIPACDTPPASVEAVTVQDEAAAVCVGCGKAANGMCWTDCGMSLCGAPICNDCHHIDETHGWSHGPRAIADHTPNNAV